MSLSGSCPDRATGGWTRRDLMGAGLGCAATIALLDCGGGDSPPSDSRAASKPGEQGQITRAEPIWRLGATEIAAGVRTGAWSCREVVEAHLERSRVADERTHAVTRYMEASALAAAEEIDRTRERGGSLGPLAGVPIAVKENLDVAGLPTSQGVRQLAERPAASDAPAVERLRRAGAIPLLRTNMPDFGLRWHTESDLLGPTWNPWNRGRTPGGSSGGDAAAVATGMVPLGLGNDYGGSLRYPAQCCGVASLRPSRGRVPHASSLSPGEPSITFQLFAVDGPIARRVRDLRLALAVMGGRDARDPWSLDVPLEGHLAARPVRVALASRPGTGVVEAEVASAVRAAGRALERAGYVVDEVELPGVDEAADLWLRLVATELHTLIEPQVRPLLSQSGARALRLAFGSVPSLDLPGFMRALAERNGIARRWSEFASRYPLILGPVSCRSPFEVGLDLRGAEEARSIIDSMRLVVAVNLLGLPAAVVPVGLDSLGLPCAVQVVGGMLREDLCLAAAEVIEDAFGTLTPIDPRSARAGA